MLGMFKFNHQVGTDMRMSTMIIKLVCSFPHTRFHIKLGIGMPQDTHINMYIINTGIRDGNVGQENQEYVWRNPYPKFITALFVQNTNYKGLLNEKFHVLTSLWSLRLAMYVSIYFAHLRRSLILPSKKAKKSQPTLLLKLITGSRPPSSSGAAANNTHPAGCLSIWCLLPFSLWLTFDMIWDNENECTGEMKNLDRSR